VKLVRTRNNRGHVVVGAYASNQGQTTREEKEQNEIELIRFFSAMWCAELIADYTSRFHPWPYLHLGAPDSFGYVVLREDKLALFVADPESIPEEHFLGHGRGEPYRQREADRLKAKKEIVALAERETERLRGAGWKQPDFAKALEKELHSY
jgi:hypothetical protein